MDNTQIKQIGDYLKNLENRLNSQVFTPTSFQIELPKLYQTIKLLMNETSKTKDKKLKRLLAYMELRLRKCKKVIEERLGVKN